MNKRVNHYLSRKFIAPGLAAVLLAMPAQSQGTEAQAEVEADALPPPSAIKSLTVKRIYFGPGGNNMAGIQVNTNNPVRNQFRALQGRWIRVDVATVGQTMLCPVGQWAWIAEYGDDGPRTYFSIICAARVQ